MATVQLIAPATGASTVSNINTSNYNRFYIAASVLATTETVLVNVILPDGVAVAAAPDCVLGTYTGCTATAPVKVYNGGPDIQVVKSVTAGACGVYLIPVGNGMGGVG